MRVSCRASCGREAERNENGRLFHFQLVAQPNPRLRAGEGDVFLCLLFGRFAPFFEQRDVREKLLEFVCIPVAGSANAAEDKVKM